MKTKYVTAYALIFIFMYMVFFHDYWKSWRGNGTPFQYDVDQYYSYLPAAFIHHDLDFKFSDRYWMTKAPNGNKVPKMSCGMAIMYSPFFFLGHKIAINEHSALDGYSDPYKICVHW